MLLVHFFPDQTILLNKRPSILKKHAQFLFFHWLVLPLSIKILLARNMKTAPLNFSRQIITLLKQALWELKKTDMTDQTHLPLFNWFKEQSQGDFHEKDSFLHDMEKSSTGMKHPLLNACHSKLVTSIDFENCMIPCQN